MVNSCTRKPLILNHEQAWKWTGINIRVQTFTLPFGPIKLKFTLEQATKAQRGEKCIFTLSLTSALDGVGGQRHALVALPSRKTRLVAKLVTTDLKTVGLYTYKLRRYVTIYIEIKFYMSSSNVSSVIATKTNARGNVSPVKQKYYYLCFQDKLAYSTSWP
jgi:hypothetical protein